MLSYLIGIKSTKTIENSLHTDEKTDRHEDKQMEIKTKKKS